MTTANTTTTSLAIDPEWIGEKAAAAAEIVTLVATVCGTDDHAITAMALLLRQRVHWLDRKRHPRPEIADPYLAAAVERAAVQLGDLVQAVEMAVSRAQSAAAGAGVATTAATRTVPWRDGGDDAA